MSQYNIDPSRVYVTGVSMGGMGAWDALRWEPQTFAAAIPMSGGADPATAPIIKDIPVWAFHGSADDIVPVTETRQIIQALQALGANPKYTEIAGAKHVIWNPIYYDAGHTLYSWLFAQHKPAAGAPVASPAVTVPVVAAPKPKPKPAPKPVFSSKPVKIDKPIKKAPEVKAVVTAPPATKPKSSPKLAKR
jgi:poly(3-hydroxybutyrate) depolymerase